MSLINVGTTYANNIGSLDNKELTIRLLLLNNLWNTFRNDNGALLYRWRQGQVLTIDEKDVIRNYLLKYYRYVCGDQQASLDALNLEEMLDELLDQGIDPL
jgi:hypothetical protein